MIVVESSYWLGFLSGAVAIAGGLAIPYLGLLVARKAGGWRLTRRFPSGSPLLRKVVGSDTSMEVHLECGHEYELELGCPPMLPCPKCTQEVGESEENGR
jgi:hypothetical protein